MGGTTIFIFAIVVSISRAVVYDPFGNGNTEDDYSNGIYGSAGDGGFQRDELNQLDREKLLFIVKALLQQGNNPYNPFTDLFTFKGKGKNRISWRKWLNWNKSNANLGM